MGKKHPRQVNAGGCFHKVSASRERPHTSEAPPAQSGMRLPLLSELYPCLCASPFQDQGTPWLDALYAAQLAFLSAFDATSSRPHRSRRFRGVVRTNYPATTAGSGIKSLVLQYPVTGLQEQF